jgi:hypothetical protein
MGLIHGHGAVEEGLGREVVELTRRALIKMPDAPELQGITVVPIGPAREPVLRVVLADGTRADFRLEQWELIT